MDKIESAKKYFEAYPAENVIHITSDGQVFLNRNHNDAANHQRHLDEKQKVTTVRRSDVFNPKPTKVDEKPSKSPSELPDDSWTKKDIADWLKVAGVAVTGKEKKDELLALVNQTNAEEEDVNETPVE